MNLEFSFVDYAIIFVASFGSNLWGRWYESRASKRREDDLIFHYEGLINAFKLERAIYKATADAAIAKLKEFEGNYDT
jgi:hypothetical protein